MILCRGELLESQDQGAVLDQLEGWIDQTLSAPPLLPERTISACHRLALRAERGEFDSVIARLDLDPALRDQQVTAAVRMLRRESLEAMVAVQLGERHFEPVRVAPPYYEGSIMKRRYPLGVLMHIAAGNMDGLPVFTVIEGLLAGNINLLKLPSADSGLSVTLLHQLVCEEPALADYVYVFDTPSTDLAALNRLARLSNGVVVWGGEGAVSAVRAMAPAGVKLIEWGHRLSFAYVTRLAMRDRTQIEALAGHIMQTKQMLCSSCQTIFLDTEDQKEQSAFAALLLPALDEAARRYPVRTVDALAQTTLSRYTASLERAAGRSEDTILEGEGCCVVLKPDRELELSLQNGSPIVKCLPRGQLLSVLRRRSGVLQTAGLLCAPEERGELTELLARAGVVRITGPGEMSRGTCLDAHDGEYPLQRYTRVVEYDEQL